MQSTWIVDVIADLRTYARTNDLSALAEQLDDALMVAAIETSTVHNDEMSGDIRAYESLGGNNTRAVGAGDRA